MGRFSSRRAAGDDGVMLIMVLVFVMVVGLALGALLPYTQVGVSEAGVARDVRSTQNAVDGAIQGAIAQVRKDLEQGNERSNRCDNYNAASYPPPLGADVGVTVTCTNALGPGGGGPGPDLPPYAIVTTAHGMAVTGNHPLSVDGGLYISGDITTSNNGSVVVLGDAYATGTCQRVYASGKSCPTTGIPGLPPVDAGFPSALGLDANAAQTTIDGLIKDPPGTCASDTSVITFQPGYYSVPPSVDASCSSNTTKTWWFSPCQPYPACTAGATSPGIYYFNFADGSYDNYTDDQSALDLETLQVDVIAGSLIGSAKADTDASTLKGSAAPGHRCDQARQGVQIVLGGPSRIATGSHSEIEVCASETSPTSPQRIALYGLASNLGTHSPAGPRDKVNDASLVGVPGASPATTPSGLNAFTDASGTGPNPDGARIAGDGLNVAFASFSGTNPVTTYGATITNFPQIAAGSLVSHAYLDVTHLETSNKITRKLTITYSDGQSEDCTVPAEVAAFAPGTLTQGALVKSRVDLMTDCPQQKLVNEPNRWKKLNPDTGPANLSVTYTASGDTPVPAGAKAAVDGIQLETEIEKPRVEAERCASSGDINNHDGCVGTDLEAYNNTTSTATSNTYFIGTVYTPAGLLNVVVHNSPNTIFQRGVVVSGITIVDNASSTQTDPPFQLPHSAVRNRTVLFTATSDGRVRLRALVHFIDCRPAPACETTPNAPGNLVWPGKMMQIREWTTLQ